MLSQSKQCNTKPCPGRHHCHYLKCRLQLHAASNSYYVQVYHHHKEPHNVHHCKLYDNAFGVKACHCFCWYLNPAGQVNSAPEAATIAAKAKAQCKGLPREFRGGSPGCPGRAVGPGGILGNPGGPGVPRGTPGGPRGYPGDPGGSAGVPRGDPPKIFLGFPKVYLRFPKVFLGFPEVFLRLS